MDKDNIIIVSENTTQTHVDTEVSNVDVANEGLDVVVEDVAPLDIDISDDNIVDIEISEAFPFATDGVLEEDLYGKDILIDGGVALKEDQEVVRLEDILEKCAAMGGSDNIAHGTLYGVEFPNQHPITAITNLREELDSIEALQTVYSDKQGCADYYPWEDENPAQEDRVGYFVAICGDARTIKICNSEDIFGVVVDRAAFVGGRDHILENHTIGGVGDVAQSSAYGLVATAGTAVVYCETDVEVGDYVISNDDGFAKKSGGNFGYLVIAINELEDIRSATISLTIPSTALAAMSDDINIVNQRIDVAETNITSAINIANAAYKMASENDNSVITNEELLEMIENAVADVNSDMSRVEGNLADAMIIVEQAKKISENAAATAESIRKDAVETANKALAEVSQTIDEFDATVEEIKNTADSAEAKAEAALEEITQNVDEIRGVVDEAEAKTDAAIAEINKKASETNARLNEVKDTAEGAAENAENARKNIEDLEDELSVLSNWSDDNGNSGVSGFVAKTNADSSTLADIVKWQGTTDTAIAGVTKTANDNAASITDLVAWQGQTNTAISNVEKKADNNEASITTINTWQDATDKAIVSVQELANKNEASITSITKWQSTTDTAISQVTQKADTNEGNISLLTKWQFDVESDVKSIASIKVQSDNNKSLIEGITAWQDSTDKTLTSVQNQSTANAASIASITTWQNTTDKSIAAVEQKADKNEGNIILLTEWQSDVKDEVSSIASIQTQANENKAQIQAVAKRVDGNSSGIAGLTTTVNDHSTSINNFAKWQETVEDGSIESIASVKNIADANKSSIEGITSWQDTNGKTLASVQQQATANESNITILTEWKSSVEEDVSSIASIQTKANENEINLLALAKRIDTNSNGIAGLNTTVDEHSASIENFAEWQETVEDGSINSIASVRSIANSNKSAIDLLSKREDDSEKAIAALKVQTSKDSASIFSLVSLIDTYSLGERSQANGLTLEQAANILEAGSVYVPTEDHSETYGEDVYEFSKGYHYTWDGTKWQESKSPFVAFSEQYVIGNDALNFWVPAVNIIEDDIVYEKDTLYMWKDERWLAVATLKDNANSRATSMILQKQNEISLSVNNAHKDIAALDLRVDENENSIGLVVSKEGENSVINAASIVAAVNDSASSVVIKADHVQLDGVVSLVNTKADEITTLVNTKTDEVKNNAVYDTKVEYALSSSETDFVAITEWSTTAPTWQDGAYMWQKTTITKGDTSVASTQTCIQGAKGEDGYTPVLGKDYFNGTNGENGTSIVWKGSFSVAPNSPENGWAYYNTSAKASYTYQNGSWYQMSIDGVDGKDGKDGNNGRSIVWKGESSSAPTNPQENWVYKDSDDGKVYIYTGSGWELMVLDGSDGQDGTNGSNGLSVFITYNDSSTTPNTPTGNGTANGWHTNATSTSIWMSQKVAENASSGAWGSPIKIKGEKGQDGKTPVKGVDYFDGSNGKDGTSIVWKGTYDSAPSNPENGWAYYDTNAKASYVYQNGWYQMSVDGVGVNGTTVTYGKSTSATTKPTSWTTTIPTVTEGEYLWTQTVIDYTDASKPDTVTYTYAKQGADGQPGVAGTSVTVISILYQVGSSATQAPTGTNWSQNVVAVPQGKYLWSKTTFSDGNVAYGVSRQGQDGLEGSSIVWKGELSARPASGEKNWVYKDAEDGIVYICTGNGLWEPMVLDGNDGADGAPGTNGLSVFITYNDSATTPNTPTGNGTSNGWHTNATSSAIWMSQKVAKDAASGSWGAPIKIQGKDGKDGVGVSSTTVSYGTSTSATTQPTSWQSTMPNVTDGHYLWTRTITDYTDSSVADTVTYTYVKQGSKGETGSPGTSVTVTSIQYQAGESSTTAPTGTWSDTIVSAAEGKYLWTKTTFSDGKVAYGVAKQGVSGKDGSGIKKVNTHLRSYPLAWWKEHADPECTDVNWTTGTSYDNSHIKQGDTIYIVGVASDVLSASGTAVTVTLYGVAQSITSSNVTIVPSHLITSGEKGDGGKDGVGVKSSTVTYGVSDSASVKPTSWGSSMPVIGENQYLWTCTVIDYTDASIPDTVTYTYAKQGAKGETGSPGTSVKVSSIQYQAGTSATVEPTGNWSNNVVPVNEGQYLWTKTTFSDGNVAYGVAKQGTSGQKGDDAPKVTKVTKQYYLSSSSTSLTGGSWSTSPSDFTKGRYMWTRDVYSMSDGSTINGEPVIDKTFTTISGWCSANNMTLIDGANIATGTIDAEQIAAKAIKADKVDVDGVITAAEGDIKKLASEEITSTYVTAQNLKVKAANVEDKLTATQIDVTGLLTAAEGDIKNLVSETIAVTELNADNLTSGTINASVVDVTNLSADNITSGAIDASVIDVTNLDADNITTGAISFNGGDYYISVTGDSGNYLVLPGLKISQEKAQFSGSIDVNKNFIVDEYGNVTLNGSISWGAGSSPTQIVYARDAIAAPESGTQLSDFPATDADGWHTSFSQTYDYFASYTYDGGKTWTDAVNIQGKDGSKPYVEDGYWYVDGVSTGVQVTYYTWVKYADTPTSGMSNIPDGKAYIGLAHNKTSTEASEDYDDYTWSLMKGEDGKDGKTYYTWVKYADDASGTNMSNDPTGKEYIGLAHNKETPTESTNASDYSWALFKGSDGVDGTDGKDGETPYIKESYWWIGATNTNIKAEGVDGADGQNGDTPYIKDGYWWIGDVNTNIQAEGKDGQDGKDGNNGSTVKVEYLYYSKQDSSAPSKPVYPGNALTLGWSFEPQSASLSSPYVFVSQCTVIDDVYGTWSTPTCWAKYGIDGKNGSDASVTTINMFNAVTNNGAKQGCFELDNGDLAINASYIKSGQIDTSLLNVDEIISSGKIAVMSEIPTTTSDLTNDSGFAYTSDIPTDTQITIITGEYIKTASIYAQNLEVDAAHIKGSLTIGQLPDTVAEKSDVPTKTSDLTNDSGFQNASEVTTITNDTISTTNVVAQNLTVKAANIDGQLTADQINADGISANNANISGTLTAGNGSFIGPFNIYEDGMGAVGDYGMSGTWISKQGVTCDKLTAESAEINGGSITASSGSLSGMTSISTDWVAIDSNSVSIRHPDDPYHFWYLSMSAGDSSASIGGTGGSISFGSVVTLNGTWAASSCLGTSSDERVKNSIQSISTDERYDVMFDALAPSVYKYNDGTSGRTHTGYIAQDVLAAVESAGLTSTDFAGYIKAQTINPETGEETETCYLRYEEFIALNTAQIQKLKARVAELEAKLLGDA